MDAAAGRLQPLLVPSRRPLPRPLPLLMAPFMALLIALLALAGCAPRTAPPSASSAPFLRVPVVGVRLADLSSNFRAPRPGGRLHEGLDILAARGTPVVSAGHGTVSRIGHTPLGGPSVWVQWDEWSFYYAHLDGYAPGLRVGQRVVPGTPLGYVGNGGNADGGPFHLHFGVYLPGGAVDPLPLLIDRPGDG